MKKAGNKGEEKNTVNRGLVRPRFMDLSEFLGKFPLEDQTNKIEELIDVGAFITACTPSHIAERNIASDSLYYHEVRELYIAWKVQCRKFFKMDTKNFQNEYEIFSESDSIPLSIHVEKTDETYNSVSNEMLRDIATEIRLKLPILRDARAKIGRLYPETPSEGGVSELTVVGVIDGQGTYTLIVNKVYGQPIEKKMSNGSSGQLLYDLSDTKNNDCIYVENYVDQADKYWNCVKVNPLYSKLKYKPTTIIIRKDGRYICRIKISRISKDTYVKKKQQVKPGK
ncbi:MAG: hypothetical protein A2481_02385 [Candidatus Yonathbacteria bacterium RIFOXYC2_FULL_47_9]|nr:MAG: hypothetical protein A2481_02385 [Candidatus Yonathbacteria bacterium RIFOXYC2_FULL_47_9]HAT68546.1 hypothetical protein [Candidatus Yonathbacteria bacterium]